MSADRWIGRFARGQVRQNLRQTTWIVALLSIPLTTVLTLVMAYQGTRVDAVLAERYAFGLAGFRAALPAATPNDSLTAVLDLAEPVQAAAIRTRVDNIRLRGTTETVTVSDQPTTLPLLSAAQRITTGRAPATRDELAVSEPVLRSASAEIGDVLTLDSQRRLVVGVVLNPTSVHGQYVLAAPQTLSHEEGDTLLFLSASEPAPDSRALLRDLGAIERTTLDDGGNRTGADGATAAAVGVAVGLQTALLTAAAALLGAHRQRRSLALLSLIGGRQRDLRSVIVLVNAVAVATALAVAGLTSSVLAAVLVQRAQGISDQLLPGVQASSQVFLIAGAFALVALITAALVALVYGSISPLDALHTTASPTQRRRRLTARTSAQVALVGGLTVTLGVVIGSRPVVLLVGLVVLVGGGLGLAGPLFQWLCGTRLVREPVSQVALAEARDGVRGAAATAIIALVVSSATALLIYGTSEGDARRAAYHPSVPPDVLVVAGVSEELGQAVEGVERAGGVKVVALAAARDVRLTPIGGGLAGSAGLVITDPDLVSRIAGRAAGRALTSGQVVVLDEPLASGGVAVLIRAADGASIRSVPTVLRTSTEAFPGGPRAYISVERARQLALERDEQERYALVYQAPVTDADVARLDDLVRPFDVTVDADRVYTGSLTRTVRLSVLAGVVTCLGVAAALAAFLRADAAESLGRLHLLGVSTAEMRRYPIAAVTAVVAAGSVLGAAAGATLCRAVGTSVLQVERLPIHWPLSLMVALAGVVTVGAAALAGIPRPRR